MDNDKAAKIKDSLDQIANYEPSSLMQRPEKWGTINFEPASDAILKTHLLASRLRSLPWEEAPPSILGKMESAAANALNGLRHIDGFKIEQDQVQGNRSGIIQHVQNSYTNLLEVAYLVEPYLAHLASEGSRRITEVQSIIAQIEGNARIFEKSIEGMNNEATATLKALKETAASTGVESHKSSFQAESQSRREAAKWWLGISALMALVTLGVAISTYYMITPKAGAEWLVHYAVSKAVVLALLIAITAWCGSNYKANMHLATVNSNKANALSTFRTFVQAAEDKTIRDAVLLETTRAIFTSASTGYLGGESVGDSGSKVIEIVKGAVGGNASQS